MDVYPKLFRRKIRYVKNMGIYVSIYIIYCIFRMYVDVRMKQVHLDGFGGMYIAVISVPCAVFEPKVWKITLVSIIQEIINIPI